MTAAAATSGTRRGPGLAIGVAVIAVAVVVLAVLGTTGGRSGGATDDPTSTAPDGAKGLALLVGALGGTIDTSGRLPDPHRGVALVLDDRLSGAARQQLLTWVRDGGTLVVADPSSDLAGVAPAEGPTPDSAVAGEGQIAPGCGAPWVTGVDAIDVPGVPLLARPPGATRACFGGSTSSGAIGSDAPTSTSGSGSSSGWFAIERAVGQGSVVSLASPDVWTNAELDHAANSVLAANLLVPADGARLAWLTGTVGGGRRTLNDLISNRVWEMLGGGVLAVVVLAFARARRLGRPVDEMVPVVIPGSELVAATGRLLGRNGRRDRAAELLRADLAREAARVLHEPASDDRRRLAGRLADATGRDQAEVAAMLDGDAPADDDGLITLATQIEQLREEIST